MGYYMSKLLRTESHNENSLQDSDRRGDVIGFPQPYQNPRSIDDDNNFPLDGKDITSVFDKELLLAFFTAPRLHDFGSVTVSRVSKDLVIKGGPVPKVHRAFAVDVPHNGNMFGTPLVDLQLVLMDYIKGSTVEKVWRSFDLARKKTVAQQVADVINKMQSTVLNHLPLGPIGKAQDETSQGPWFTDYGAGPFDTLKDLED
ncbi:kinase-like (PK-like) [Fusarium acutatum]|uniref:Kinase-like (PK-like) n=1 Tax=Fusarium acutatum TaxID=78861 RepID=A0A8H4NDT9_9HYPO|nr:kinase-like (PK-like) [Fusarium acutatum]